VDECVGVQVKL